MEEYVKLKAGDSLLYILFLLCVLKLPALEFKNQVNCGCVEKHVL